MLILTECPTNMDYFCVALVFTNSNKGPTWDVDSKLGKAGFWQVCTKKAVPW